MIARRCMGCRKRIAHWADNTGAIRRYGGTSTRERFNIAMNILAGRPPRVSITPYQPAKLAHPVQMTLTF